MKATALSMYYHSKGPGHMTLWNPVYIALVHTCQGMHVLRWIELCVGFKFHMGTTDV